MAQVPKIRAQSQSTLRQGLPWALATGILITAAYPPWSLWPLAFFAYSPLLYWLHKHPTTVKQAALLGLIPGTILHAGVFWFLIHTMEAMSGFPLPLAFATLVGYALAMGVHQALFTVALRLTLQTELSLVRGLLHALALATVYACIEFAVPYLFPWYLGNAFFQQPNWLQTAEIVGICGTSLLVMLVNLLLARAWLDKKWHLRYAVIVGVLLIFMLAYGGLRMKQVDDAPVKKTLKTLIVQANATLKEKLSEGRARMPMLDRAEKIIRQADLSDRDLVILPEGAMPFFWIPDAVGPAAEAERKIPTHAAPILREAKQRMLTLVHDEKKPILLGSLRRLDRMWLQEARNAAFLLWPDGREQVYDKKILLPFGEYLPFTSVFPALKESIPGVSHMDPGTASGKMEVAGVKMLVNICYEALFANFLLSEGPDAEVLVNLTNDIWFGPEPAPSLHLMVQQARAVELRRPLLRSTVTGITVHVSADGVMHDPTQLYVEATRRYDAQVRDLDSPYRHWGDVPMWLLTVASALFVLRHALRYRRSVRST